MRLPPADAVAAADVAARPAADAAVAAAAAAAQPGARYEQYGIRFAVTVAGDVETFDAAEFRLRLAVALDGAVEPATIEVEAGSVRVSVTLWTADEASAAALLDKLRVVMATADAASTALEPPSLRS